MGELYVVIGAIVITIIIALVVETWKNKYLRDQVDCLSSSIKYLEDRIAYRDREGERNFKELVGGIDGVTSVSLSSKRYVELLKAENDLAELKTKVRNTDNE